MRLDRLKAFPSVSVTKTTIDVCPFSRVYVVDLEVSLDDVGEEVDEDSITLCSWLYHLLEIFLRGWLEKAPIHSTLFETFFHFSYHIDTGVSRIIQ